MRMHCVLLTLIPCITQLLIVEEKGCTLKRTVWLDAHLCIPLTAKLRRTATTRSNTLESIGVMKMRLSLATEEKGGPFGIRFALASLQQSGKLPKRINKSHIESSGSKYSKYGANKFELVALKYYILFNKGETYKMAQ